jgi:hypothetical protein
VYRQKYPAEHGKVAAALLESAADAIAGELRAIADIADIAPAIVLKISLIRPRFLVAVVG